MRNILIISGHTDLEDSVANKTILEIIGNKMPEAEIDYLDKLYPDYRINVEAEQEKLVKADIIVLQFPVFWYTMPSLLSKWVEETFQHGFSHGSTGDKLKGKKLLVSITTGAPEEMYRKDGAMGYEIEEFLPFIQATCNLCGMEYAGFIHTGGVSYQMRCDPEQLTELKAKAEMHAQRLMEKLDSM